MVYKLINQGDIKAIKVGRTFKISESALDAYIATQEKAIN
jgi:excisionase family DNA binding protein